MRRRLWCATFHRATLHPTAVLAGLNFYLGFFSCIGILPFPSLTLLRVSGNCVSDALDRLKASLSPTLPREELESFVSSGVLSHLQLSFSRDHQDGADGTGGYVQDNLKLQGRHITHILLQQKGSIYVCGWDWRRRLAAAIVICCYRCLKRVPLSTRNTRYVLDERNPLPPFVPNQGWRHCFWKLRLYFVHSEMQKFSLPFRSHLPLRGKCSFQADYPVTGPSTRLFILPWLTLMFRLLEWLKENKTCHAGRISILCRL